jgi:hypothetical protein
MFGGRDRGETREVFFRAWRAHREGSQLEGMEQLIVQVALRHPEYHALLETPDTTLDRDYPPDSGAANPFLHLGMHIAVEEQLAVDQPKGIRGYYRRLLEKFPDEHAAQHRIMECLSEMLWQSQRHGAPPDAGTYLKCLARVTGDPDIRG